MNARPKVAHITTVDLSLRYLLLNQLKYIEAAGFEVVGVSATGPDVPLIESHGIRHIAVPLTRRMTPFADLLALFRLYRCMRKERFDVVHTHTPKAGLLGQLAAKLARVPHIVNTLHGFYFYDGTPKRKRAFYVGMEKLAATCSDAILSQNNEDIETAIREGIARPDQIVELGNGIDVDRFDASLIDAEALRVLRSSLGLPEDALVVGFVGRLVEEKGILDLLNAAKRLAQTHAKMHFLIVGPIDSEKSDAIQPSVAKEYGIDDRCVFAGQRDDMPEMYALMDVLVLPSYREGFPRAPMEASAMGLPTVVTDIRGCRQTTLHEETGLRYACGDIDALVAALERLADNTEERREMGAAGSALARKEFDERRVFSRVLQTYTQLMGPSAPVTTGRPGDRAMNVLVTGAAGFIGSHVSALLLKKGHRVIGPRQPQ